MIAGHENPPARTARRQHVRAATPARSHARNFPWIRFIAFLLVAVGLVWIVVTRSLGAYLAGVDPEAALRLQSGNPTALLSLAITEVRLRQAPSPSEAESSGTGDGNGEPPEDAAEEGVGQGAEPLNEPTRSIADIRSLAERAIRNDPLNARAFSLLGQVSENEDETKAFMETAVRRSRHQRSAAYWLMMKSYEEQKLQDALSYADTLLRSHPQAMPHVIPVLGRIAELDGGKEQLDSLLATNPPWRPSFFSQLPSAVTDARTPLNLLFALNATAVPANAADIRNYVLFLIRHKFYDLAYYVWLQFLPPDQLSSVGHLFNGGFETPTTGLPFDWTFGETSGAVVKIVQPHPDAPGEHAMFLEFGPGRVDFRGVRQMILLSPGQYQFRGLEKLDIVSQRGLRWVVRCVGGDVIGSSPLVKGTQPEWTAFEFSFSVPGQDCPAQYVQLTFDARSESERFISGTVWYDRLEVERETDAPAVTGPTDGSGEPL